jgi:hypothetical protein
MCRLDVQTWLPLLTVTLTAAIFFGVASLMKAPPRPDDAKSTHRLLLAAGTEQIAPAFVIEAMNGTGASPAVRIKGRPAQSPGGL